MNPSSWRMYVLLSLAVVIVTADSNIGSKPVVTTSPTPTHNEPLAQDDIDSLISQIFGDRSVVPISTKPDNIPVKTTIGPPVSNTNGETCHCVPYYLCKQSTIDDYGTIDIRYEDDANQYCESYLDVCCKPSDVVEADKPKESKKN